MSSISGPDTDDADAIALAEGAARDHGQRPSFVVWPRQAALDAVLAARGYGIEDAVGLWTLPTADAARPPVATAFPVWPPLAIMRDLWDEGGIGPARRAVMARAVRPTGLLARLEDRPAGVAFVAAHGGSGDGTCEGAAMLSAAYVPPAHRRKGAMGMMLRAAAFWAREAGCGTLGLVATRHNHAANAAYAAHGMTLMGGYHYRRAPSTAAA